MQYLKCIEKNKKFPYKEYFDKNTGYIKVLRYINNKWIVIMKQRDIYQNYYNCCLLKNVIIDHINEDKTDNRIENLRPMYRGNHMIRHNTIDKTNRKCNICKSNKTYKRNWYKDSNGVICNACYMKIWTDSKVFLIEVTPIQPF